MASVHIAFSNQRQQLQILSTESSLKVSCINIYINVYKDNYWALKLHKNPTKVSFTIATPKCSVKPLSKAFAVALKLNYKQFDNCIFKAQHNSGIKT